MKIKPCDYLPGGCDCENQLGKKACAGISDGTCHGRNVAGANIPLAQSWLTRLLATKKSGQGAGAEASGSAAGLSAA